jgi:ribosomal protein S18 acetylase RimI-like enzyme
MIFLTVPLNSSHKKEDFNSGTSSLDNYLHTQAKQDVKRRLSACFVLSDNEGKVKGYYTLSSTSIPRHLVPDALRKNLPPSYIDLPATLLGRLAIDTTFQGQRLGELLLIDALRRSLSVSKEIASLVVVVDPLNNSAKTFYNKFGFILLPDSGKMFLQMSALAKLF